MVATISNRELFVPDGDRQRPKSTRLAHALLIELLHYGIQPDEEIVNRISRHRQTSAHDICDRILKMYTIGDLNPPLFQQWEERTEFTFEEFTVQILGYIFQLSGNDLADPGYMASLKDHIDFKKMKRLRLADSKRARARFQRLVSSRVALEKASQQDLVALARIHHTIAPERIHSAEARMAVLLGMIESGMSLYDGLQQLNAEPADALRYAAAMHDFDGVSLPSDVRYAKLTWSERTQLMKFLGGTSFEDLCEAMGINRTAWFRFFKHAHVFRQRDFRNRFTSVVAAGLVSVGSRVDEIPGARLQQFLDSHSSLYDITKSGNLAFRTFASRVQSAVDAKDFERFRAEVEKRPGYLLRNIGSLSNVCTRRTEGAFVDLIRDVIDQASAGVLLSIVQIDVNAKYRIIDSKGNTTVRDADYSPVIGEIQNVAQREIYRRFGFPGKVLVQPKLKSQVVPFLSTNAELDRGSRIGFEDSRYLYFLMHWVQSERHRTDLDHSYVCFDDKWTAETVFFGNQANAYITQSGDITNAPAPDGGTEYGRISLATIPANVQYIVPIMNVYCGDVFSDNETAYAGFMFSNEAEFSINRKHIRYDLNQPANSNIPFVIDVRAREIIIVDFNNRKRNGLTAHSSVEEIKKVISALKTKQFMTIERFADILSGDDESTSLTITTNAGKKGEIEPADLHSLFGPS
jgi:stress response protein SCP2